MSYSDFTLARLEEKFGVKNQRKRLFNDVTSIEPSDWLKKELLEIEELLGVFQQIIDYYKQTLM